jgi:hypothetical protein
MYQANVKGTGSCPRQVVWSVDRAGFLCRSAAPITALVVQPIGGKEVILAEGDFHLE